MVDRVGVAELGQGVAAPAVEVGAAEEQERQRRVRGVGGEQGGGVVERAQRVVAVAGGGEGFAVRGGEPRPQQGRAGIGEVAGVLGLLGGGVVLVEGGEDEGLFGGGVREQQR